jgi:hypothetical protein
LGKERSEAPEAEVLRCCAGWFSRSWCSTEQGNLRVAEIPLFYNKCKNGRFKVKIAKKKAPFTVVLLAYFYNKKQTVIN